MLFCRKLIYPCFNTKRIGRMSVPSLLEGKITRRLCSGLQTSKFLMHPSIARAKEIILRVVIKFWKKFVESLGCKVISMYLQINCNLLGGCWLYIEYYRVLEVLYYSNPTKSYTLLLCSYWLSYNFWIFCCDSLVFPHTILWWRNCTFYSFSSQPLSNFSIAVFFLALI